MVMVEDQLRLVEKEHDTADAQSPAFEQKRLDLCRLQGIGDLPRDFSSSWN